MPTKTTALLKEKATPRAELILGFQKFVKTSREHLTSWDKLDSETRSIAQTVLQELNSYSPLSLANYWVANHNRFCRRTTHANLCAMYEIIFKYTCFVARVGASYSEKLSELPDVPKATLGERIKSKINLKTENKAVDAR